MVHGFVAPNTSCCYLPSIGRLLSLLLPISSPLFPFPSGPHYHPSQSHLIFPALAFIPCPFPCTLLPILGYSVFIRGMGSTECPASLVCEFCHLFLGSCQCRLTTFEHSFIDSTELSLVCCLFCFHVHIKCVIILLANKCMWYIFQERERQEYLTLVLSMKMKFWLMFAKIHRYSFDIFWSVNRKSNVMYHFKWRVLCLIF